MMDASIAAPVARRTGIFAGFLAEALASLRTPRLVMPPLLGLALAATAYRSVARG